MRPGLIAYDLRATQSRLALHTIQVLRGAGGVAVTTPRTSILPYVGNTVAGRYRFTQSEFITSGTAWLGVTLLRDPATAVFEVSIDPLSDPDFVDVWVTVAGVATNLAVGQGFAFSLAVRDS